MTISLRQQFPEIYTPPFFFRMFIMGHCVEIIDTIALGFPINPSPLAPGVYVNDPFANSLQKDYILTFEGARP